MTLPLLALTLFAATTAPGAVVTVRPGEAIQPALDALAERGGGACRLLVGEYVIRESLKLMGGVTLAGEGEQTRLVLAPGANCPLLVNREPGIADVTLRDLLLDGGLKPEEQRFHREDARAGKGRTNTFGILFTAPDDRRLRRIRVERVRITRCAMGCHIKGADDVTLADCELYGNGAVRLYYHNLYLRRCTRAEVTRCVLRDSPTGNGFNGSYLEEIALTGCVARGNAFRGLRVAETAGVTVSGCTAEENGQAGIIINSEKSGCRDVRVSGNTCRANKGNGIEIRSAKDVAVTDNRVSGSGEHDLAVILSANVTLAGNTGRAPHVERSRDVAGARDEP